MASRRILLEKAGDSLPDSQVELLGNNFDFLRALNGDAFFPTRLTSFGSIFDRITDGFRDYSPHYDHRFDVLSRANSRLVNPYPDVSLHIYVQNSMTNKDGEVVTEKFECADGFPNDLQKSCHDLQTKETKEETLEEAIEEIFEEELTSLEQEEAEEELPVEEQFEPEDLLIEDSEEEAEAETGVEKEPSFFDQIINFFTPESEQTENEEITAPAGDTGIAEPEQAEVEVETELEEEPMMMHDCGGMMGNDDELIGRQIPFSPFSSLLDLLFDTPVQEPAILEPRRDPFESLFPWKLFDSQIQELNEEPEVQQIQFVFPMNHMKRVDVTPTTTSAASEELYGNFQDNSTYSVSDYTIETTILATLLFIFAFLGFRRACRKTTCKEQCGEPEITTEKAKEMTELPKDFQEQLIATEPLETDVEDVDRPVTPYEVATGPIEIKAGDGI